MTTTIFSGDAQIEFQGDRVLRFIGKDAQKVEYQILGFEDAPVRLVDYRSAGIDAIEQVLETGNVDQFPAKFNLPAQVTITSPANDKLKIELRESNSTAPKHMLWVAVGLGDEIPVYDYVFSQTVAITESTLAFLSLYRRPEPGLR